jgi:hypothetical protein
VGKKKKLNATKIEHITKSLNGKLPVSLLESSLVVWTLDSFPAVYGT